MTRTWFLTLPVVVVIFAVSGSSLGSAEIGSQNVADAKRVIKVVATTMPGGRRERKPPPGIAGDVITGTDRLRNAVAQFGKPKGAIVGVDRYRTVFETAAVASVVTTTTLPGGTIRSRGTADFRLATNVIRVVGGTGAFVGAKGTTEQRFLPGDKALNIYRVRLPG
jgi:hypothetical protein